MKLFSGNGILGKWSDNRTARVEARNERKIIKSDNKAITKQTAYAAGIDPNKSMWEGISSLGQSTGGAVTGIFGKPGSSFFGGGTGASAGGPLGIPVFGWIGIGIGLFLIFRK